MPRSGLSRLARASLYSLGGLLLLLAIAIAGAAVLLQGPRLGRLVEGLLPPMRGRIQVAGIHWRLRLLPDLLLGRPTPLLVDGVRVTDPEGTVVLESARLSVGVEVHFAPLRIRLHGVRPGTATWRFAELKRRPPPGGSGIGFLAAFEPRGAAPPASGPAPRFLFELASAELDGLTAIFDFPAWGLELRDIRADGTLVLTSLDPKAPFFGFDVNNLDARRGGFLRILSAPATVLPFDRVGVRRVATTRDWPDDIFLDLEAARTGRSSLRGKGFFTGLYGATSIPGIDIHAQLSDAADALQAVAAGFHVPGLALGGRGASAVLDLKKPFAAMQVAAAFRGLDASYARGGARVQALGLGFDLGFDGGAGRVDLRRLSFRAPGGGRLGLDLSFDTNKIEARADLRLEDFATGGYLPAGLRPLAAGRLSGKLHAEAGFARKAGAVRLDLTLLRSARGKLPPSIRVHGEAAGSALLVKTGGLVVEIPGASATASGQVSLARRQIAAGLEVAAADLARVLRDLGLPPIARDARLEAEVRGSLGDPAAEAKLVAHRVGLPPMSLPEVDVDLGLTDGRARLQSLRAPAFGGEITASGTVQLWTGTAARLLRSPVVDLRLDGAAIDLGQLLQSAAVAGLVSFHTEAHGPADKLRVQVSLPAGTRVRVLGEDLDVGPVEAELDGKTVLLRTLRVARAAGGTIELRGRMTLGGAMALDLTVERLSLAHLAGPGVELSGFASARLHVEGSPRAPAVSGALTLEGVVAAGVTLGGGEIALSTDPAGALRADGRLFDRFHVQALVSLGEHGPRGTAGVDFQDLALEDLLPQIVDLGGGRGTATGRVEISFQPGAPPALDARLTGIQLSLAREVVSPSGKLTSERIAVENDGDIHFTMTDGDLALDPVHLVTDSGELRLQGHLGPEEKPGMGRPFSGELAGHFDLEFLQPFLRTTFLQMSGDAEAQLRAAGRLHEAEAGLSGPPPIELDALDGEIAIDHPIEVRPVGFDSVVTIPSGQVRIGRDFVRLQDLSASVVGSLLRLDGKMSFDPVTLKPRGLDMGVSGDLGGQLLELALPEAVSDSTGRARIEARVGGTLDTPEIAARIDLQRIDFRLRSIGREVEIQSGIVEVDREGAKLYDVKALVDTQGLLVIGAAGVGPGRVSFSRVGPLLQPGRPPIELGEIRLPLHGERLGYRASDVFEIDDLAFDLTLAGDLAELAADPADAFFLAGEVRLMSGRFTQDFDIADQIVRPRINESSVRPFYEGEPALAGLGLDLRVRTVGDAFVVQDNLTPEMHVDVNLHVGGTVANPRLAGDIRPTDGRFQIPGFRGDFDLVPNVNNITFVDTKSIASGDTPEVSLEVQGLVTDSAGNDHNVHIQLSGPIGQMQINLFSDDGLDRNQVALLLLTGRIAEGLTGAQSPTLGANVSTAADVTGQITRDALDNLMRPYVNDVVQRLTGLELRLTAGPDGFEGRLRQRITRYLRWDTDYLLGFQNQQHFVADVSQWAMDYLSLSARYEWLTFSQQQGLTETVNNLTLGLSFEFPVRPPP